MKLTDLKRAGHAPTLFAAFCHFDVSFMVWVILGALAPYFATDPALTGGHKAAVSASVKLTLVGVPLLAAGFWRILLGILVDRIGPKRVGVASLSLTLMPLLIGWQMPGSYGNLLIVGFFLGLAGASFAVALPLASRWYPPEMQGIALGIAGAGNSGTVMATVFAPILARSYGWHAVFGLLTIPVLATLAVFAIFAKEPPSRKPVTVADFASVLKSRDTLTFAFLYFVTFGGFVGLSSFLNSFFVDQYGIAKASVGLWTWPFIIAGSLLRPVGGFLADRIGGIRLLTMLYATAAIATVAIGLSIRGFVPTSAGLLILMGTLGMGNGAVFQLVPQRFKNQIGVVTGIVGAAGGIGGYYLNFALGHLFDVTHSYAYGFWAFTAIAVAALTILRLSSVSWIGNWLAEGGQANGRNLFPAGNIAETNWAQSEG